mmetsp:Transcript_10732/g.22778  ORF Transcript_10732/g.22778 Transcript_10732/m.22778 type:complete len:116 (-) Transcript_10732:175-522(-)|eukprot:CAMPEP_0171372866 /NCGR_PEP_ID=MMETSP0879-20121228/11117_1 /TAXON_ID=67004 /ORGANISM="Thalassiosira weissflogii, Strain CCMP1336" /LENGTH=115 /DNA_ID=CAMNT_0011881767 /DNA_START=87 /DNA_END=434 /DNA_ORIENTATION=+
MIKASASPKVLAIFIFVTVAVGIQAHCPTDEQFNEECLAAVTPPFPICLKKSAADWVTQAQDAAPRCCGDDKSACRCPVKGSPEFWNKIDGYCAGVGKCSEGIPDLMSHSLLRGA